MEFPLHSRVLGCWMRHAVWLPPGYTTSTRRYPVLYLLRGHHREWQRVHRAPRGYEVAGIPLRDVDIRRAMAALVRSGRIPPLIVVMPCMSNHDGTLSGLAVDWLAGHRARGRSLRGAGNGRFGTHLLDEVIPEVDRRLRTVADRRLRMVDGFSLGGFMALSLALRRPDLFAAAGAYDGSFFYLRRHQDPLGQHDRLLDHPVFDVAFGRPRSWEHVHRHSPAWLVSHRFDKAMRNVHFFIQCAPKHREPLDSNYHRAVHMVHLLERQGLRNEAHPMVLEHGHHDWPTAFTHLAMALQAFAQVLPMDRGIQPSPAN